MDFVRGDKIDGDKVLGDKIVYNNFGGLEKLANKVDNIQHRDWLKRIKADLLEFKPKTALIHLNDLEASLSALHSIDPSDHAKILLLKGMCYYEQNDLVKGQEAYLAAWSKDSDDIDCMEKAMRAFIEQGKIDAAQRLVDSVLTRQPYNSTAWAGKVYLDARGIEEKLNEVPWQIRSQIDIYHDFQTQLAGFYIHHTQYQLPALIFKEQLQEDFLPPTDINFYNKRYWLLLANLQIAEIVSKYLLSPDGVHPMIRKNPKLKQVVQVMEQVLQKLEGTEKQKFIDHYRFWHAYGRYCLSGEESDANKVEEIYTTCMAGKDHSYAALTAFALCQTHQYNKVFLLPEESPEVMLAKGHACLFSDNIAEAKTYFKSYLDQIESFQETATTIFLGLQNEMIEDQQEKTESWQQYQGKFINPTSYKIAELFSIWDQLNSEERKEKIDASRIDAQTDVKNIFILLVGNAYLKNENFTEALEIFFAYADFEVENGEHFRYIETLIASHHNDTELLQRLENWRRKGFFMPSPWFLGKEIELLQLVPDWQQIGEVADEGIKRFPFVLSFNLYKIWSLEQAGEDIRPILNSFIGRDNLQEEFVLQLAQTAFRSGLTREAIEILFPYADRSYGYINVREMYFHIFSMSAKEIEIGKLDVITEDCWVEVHTDDSQQWLQITPKNCSIEPYITLVGKSIGDTFEEHKVMSGRTILHTIVAVGDKYFRLYRTISEEITKNILGYSLESISFPSTDIESVNQVLMEQFGQQGEEQEAAQDEILEGYNTQRLSFTQVVRANGDDPVRSYHWLTGYWGKNFWVIPKRFCGNFDPSKLPANIAYILDFTSTLLFFQLSKKQQIVFPNKFLISPFLVDILKIELIRMERQKFPAMSLRIRRQSVKPFLYPEDYQETQIVFYRDLLGWIEANCIVHPNRYKLKLIGEALRNDQKVTNSVFQDAWLRYGLDTVLMTDLPDKPSILVTDDSYFKVIFKEKNNLISSEMYLSSLFPGEYEGKILPVLLESNYRNLTITTEFLEKEFQKFIKGETSLYNACINNITANSAALTTHLISIYSTSFKLLEQKRQLSQQAIRGCTNGASLSNKAYQSLIHLLRYNFRFFPHFISYVIEDVDIVCNRGIDRRGFLGNLPWDRS